MGKVLEPVTDSLGSNCELCSKDEEKPEYKKDQDNEDKNQDKDQDSETIHFIKHVINLA